MLTKSKRKTEVPKSIHVRKNDEVLVVAGKDRGKRGKVLRVFPSTGKAIVERVNFSRKHTKANPQKNIKGGILEREVPIQVSNLKVVCPSCGEPTRLGAKRTEDGSVSRVCKKCDTEFSK